VTIGEIDRIPAELNDFAHGYLLESVSIAIGQTLRVLIVLRKTIMLQYIFVVFKADKSSMNLYKI